MSIFAPYKGSPQGITKQVGKTLDTVLDFLDFARRWSRDVSSFALMMSGLPIIQGQLLEGVQAAASGVAQEFPHALGRNYRGVIIVCQSVGTITLRVLSPSSSSDSSKYFVVQLSGATAVTFSAWVF